LSLIRDRVVCIPSLKNVDWHFVPVSDFLPADEEMGQEGSGISHLTALIGVKGDERWVIAVKHKLHAGGSSVIRFTRC